MLVRQDEVISRKLVWSAVFMPVRGSLLLHEDFSNYSFPHKCLTLFTQLNFFIFIVNRISSLILNAIACWLICLTILLMHICHRLTSRTEIRGGPGGPWPPQSFSEFAAVNLYFFIIPVFKYIFRKSRKPFGGIYELTSNFATESYL